MSYPCIHEYWSCFTSFICCTMLHNKQKKKIAINLIRYTDTKSIDFNASYRKDSRLVFFSSLNCWQPFFFVHSSLTNCYGKFFRHIKTSLCHFRHHMKLFKLMYIVQYGATEFYISVKRWRENSQNVDQLSHSVSFLYNYLLSPVSQHALINRPMQQWNND